MQHVIHSKSVFAASEVAISRVNAEHRLWEKQTSGPEVQYNLQEANNSEFVATVPEENGCCSVELDCVDLNLVEIDLACAIPVKGRLRERLAFWKSIGASRWVLDVLSDGYSLPFISLPQRAFFQNHHSVAENEEFVSHEVSKLLVSGAIAEFVSLQPLGCC